MIRNYTTIEKSKALVDAGLDPKTADMRYNTNSIIHDEVELIPYMDQFGRHLDGHPCWSCARLMALLPDAITIHEDGKRRMRYTLEMAKFEPWQYAVNYVYGFYPDDQVLHETSSIDSPTDALAEMLVWVMQNGYEDKAVQCEIAEKE